VKGQWLDTNRHTRRFFYFPLAHSEENISMMDFLFVGIILGLACEDVSIVVEN
jgi:hypothetical protein